MKGRGRMGKSFVFTETVTTTVEPERAFRTAEESLVEIRLVESRKVTGGWVYEYEVSGEMEKLRKFCIRIKNIEIPNDW